MKKTLMIFLIGICVLVAVTAFAGDDPLVGQWKGSSGNEVIVFVFNADKTMTISSGEQSFGGTYAVDYKTTPINLDLVLKMGEESQTMYTVMEFVDDNHVRIEEPGPERPTGFDRDPIVFERTGAATGGPAPSPPSPEPSTGESSTRPSQEFEAKPFKPGTEQ
jgi:hypothetical protein